MLGRCIKRFFVLIHWKTSLLTKGFYPWIFKGRYNTYLSNFKGRGKSPYYVLALAVTVIVMNRLIDKTILIFFSIQDFEVSKIQKRRSKYLP